VTIKQVNINLKDLINDVLASISVPKKITISVNISEDVPKLRVDTHFLKRVFYNLIFNAFQGMHNEGNLTIVTHSTDEPVIVTVEDTG